eukprot:TRINITY_DN29216_c0_g1_i1.p1 TRINITY_DN29216_c0_g1~~TRINITY_DN29216_c0_g1_i1.p1  ORF type:complete len:343 (+),score=44.86 TRINITY_DN29216_c0_g1_i1:56-1084(+)
MYSASSSMTMARREVSFAAPVEKITEYEVQKVQVTWKRQCPSTADGEVDDDGLDEDPAERERQREMSKPTQALLALGRAAKMRAMVEACMREPSLHLPPVVGARRSGAGSSSSSSQVPPAPRPEHAPRSRQRSPRARQPVVGARHSEAGSSTSGGQEPSAPPPGNAQRSRRPAPRARQYNVPAHSQDDKRIAETQASHEGHQVDSTLVVMIPHARDPQATEVSAVTGAQSSSDDGLGSDVEAAHCSGGDGSCSRACDAAESDISVEKSQFSFADAHLIGAPLDDVSSQKLEEISQERNLAAEVLALAHDSRLPLNPSPPLNDAVLPCPPHRNFRAVANSQTL